MNATRAVLVLGGAVVLGLILFVFLPGRGRNGQQIGERKDVPADEAATPTRPASRVAPATSPPRTRSGDPAAGIPFACLDTNAFRIPGVEVQAFSLDGIRHSLRGGASRSRYRLALEANRQSSTVSDETGAGTLPAARGRLILRARRDGFAAAYVEHAVPESLPAGALPPSVDIVLVTGLAITGRVRTAGGEPVPDAALEARFAPTADTPRTFAQALATALDGAETTTGAGGAFAFRGLRAGHYDVLVRAGGYGLTVAERIASGATGVDIVLTKGKGSLEGVVRDRSGAPVPGALASLTCGTDSRPLVSVRANAEGEFRFMGIAARPWDVAVEASGYGSDSRRDVVVPDGGSVRVEFWLQAGASVTGIVVDPKDAPVAGATVFAYDAVRRAGAGPVTSGQDGSFRLDDLDPGVVLVGASFGGCTSAFDMNVRAPATGVRLKLGMAGVVRGRCVDGDGSPVQDFGLIAVPAGGGMFGSGFVALVSGAYREFHAPDGTFTLTEVPPGACTLDAKAPGYAPSRTQEFTVAVDRPAEGVVVTFTRGATVRGRVVHEKPAEPVEKADPAQPDPKPAASAAPGAVTNAATATPPPDGPVTLEPVAKARVSRMIMVQAMPMAPAPEEVETGEDGTFEMRNLPAGQNALVARHPEYASGDRKSLHLTEGQLVDGVEIVLKKGGTVEGHSFDEKGAPRSYATMIVQQPGGALHQQIGSTDGDGFYRFEKVTPGVMLVMRVEGFGGRFEMKTATVKDGETSVVDFGKKTGCTVKGKVLDAKGGVPKIFVSLMRAEGETTLDSASTADDGGFEILSVKPGSFVLFAQDMSSAFRVARAPVTILASDQEKYVELRFPDGAVEGIVVAADGDAPIAGANVYATEQGGAAAPVASITEIASRFAGQAISGGDGRFRIGGLAPGSYRLSGQKEGYGRAAIDGVGVAGGETTAGVRLGLPVEGALEGTILASSGAPVAGANVFLRNEATSTFDFIGTSTSETNGHYHVGEALAGTFTVYVQSSSYAMTAVHHVAIAAGSVTHRDITLTPGGAARITVRTAAGAPVEGASLTFTDAAGLPIVAWLSESNFLASQAQHLTDAQGVYVQQHLAAGGYAVLAVKNGVQAQGTVTVGEGSETPVDLVMP